MERKFVSMFEVEGILRGRREILLKQLRYKFGAVPAEVEERLRQITDPDTLDNLAVRLMEDASLADLGLVTAVAA